MKPCAGRKLCRTLLLQCPYDLDAACLPEWCATTTIVSRRFEGGYLLQACPREVETEIQNVQFCLDT